MRTRVAAALWVAMGIAPFAVLGDETDTGYGVYSLYSITTGTRNSGFGRGSAESISSGSDNTAVGYQALQLGNSYGNVAVGSHAGLFVDGSENTALGNNAFSGQSENASGGTSHEGSYNTAVGSNALAAPNSTSQGNYATAVGAFALYQSQADGNTAVGGYTMYYNSTGQYNTALGFEALALNTSGADNTAIGWQALYATLGSDNTAIGFAALHISQGSGATAIGAKALYSNTTAANNTAIGNLALYSTTTGGDNVAIGVEALRYNVTGQQNMAIGRSALRNSTGGGFNAVMGYASCWACRTASQNVGIGFKTLYSLSSGDDNVAIGYSAGSSVTGSNNIDIANSGIAAESGVIRIGSVSTHSKAYIAGIANSKVTGAPVYVTNDGQLGTQASALRYKTDVVSLEDPAERLGRLRPVSFHLKSEPGGPLQYGLIAEEVAKVYPELVIRDQHGVLQGVRYDELTPMLLKRMQVLEQTVTSQAQVLQAQARKIATLEPRATELASLRAEIEALRGFNSRLLALEEKSRQPGAVVASR